MTVTEFKRLLNSWLATLGGGIAAKILQAVLITVVGLVIIHLVNNLLKKALEKSKLEKAAHSLVHSVAKVIMYLVLALAVASSLGIDVTGLVALASVATLAISLALQNMLANVIGGFTLLNTHPFAAGDFVEIAGQSGTVKEIGIAYTQLTTPDNRLVFIPNSSVVAAQIVNYSTTGIRRLDIIVTASYGAPADTVVDALLKAASRQKVLQEPAAPFAALNDYKDSAIEYLVRVWVKGEDYWDVKFGLTRDIKDCFNESGIEMTYPHLNVHLDK